MTNKTSTFAVILAGGFGTRFWPASRKHHPKQFLSITGKEPMLVETASRLEGWLPASHILVVTHAAHAKKVMNLLPRIPKQNILAEPQGRNTAASIAWAAHVIETRLPGAVMLVLPADHHIQTKQEFQSDLKTLAAATADGGLYTLGVMPSYPATGYGYLECGKLVARKGTKKLFQVRRFTEKPSLKRARAFVRSGKYFWNSGIFVWRASDILQAIAQYLPIHQRVLCNLVNAPVARQGVLLKNRYRRIPAISIDYGIMEKARNVKMLAASFEWSDVGSWAALADLLQQKNTQNNIQIFPHGGEVLAIDTRQCLIYGEMQHLFALVGLKDLVIVQTPTATLICPRKRCEQVKEIVARLQKSSSVQYL